MSKDRRGTCGRRITPYLLRCCMTYFCALQVRRADEGLVPVDPPGALRRVGARRKLELSGSGGPTASSPTDRPSQALRGSRGKARKLGRRRISIAAE